MIFSAEALAEIDGAFKNASTFWKSKVCITFQSCLTIKKIRFAFDRVLYLLHGDIE